MRECSLVQIEHTLRTESETRRILHLHAQQTERYVIDFIVARKTLHFSHGRGRWFDTSRAHHLREMTTAKVVATFSNTTAP